MDRGALRLVAPMHIAETREQAMKDVEFGLQKWIDYFARVNPTAAGDDLQRDSRRRRRWSTRAAP